MLPGAPTPNLFPPISTLVPKSDVLLADGKMAPLSMNAPLPLFANVYTAPVPVIPKETLAGVDGSPTTETLAS